MPIRPLLTPSVVIFLAPAVLLPAGSAGGAAADGGSEPVAVSIAGASSEGTSICGRPRAAAQAQHRQVLKVAVTLAAPARARNARLVIDRCTNLKWGRVVSHPFDAADRRRLPLLTTQVGEYRVKAVVTDRRGQRARSSYAYWRVTYPTALTAELGSTPPAVYATYSPLMPVWGHTGSTWISGTLTSTHEDCVEDRLLYVRPADPDDPVAVAEGRTDAGGNYRITISSSDADARGAYYVDAIRRGSCAAGKSPVARGE